MNNKKTVKEYIKLYKKLIKNKASGAIGYSEWKGDGFSDLEIAARYLATKGFPVSVDTNLVDNGKTRVCHVSIVHPIRVDGGDDVTVVRTS